MALTIVTDSTSDIDPELARDLGIVVVPLFVVWGERSYRDYLDLSRARFYELLVSEKALPATSQPTAAMFEEAFAPAVERGDDVLCLTISSLLSGTFNAACAAAAQFSGARIEVVDSKSVTAGLAMLVERARERSSRGAGIDEIVAALYAERESQRMFACIPDLSHIVRTGRIGKAQAMIGTLMKIVPVLALKDGRVEAIAQVRTFSRAQEAMLDLALHGVPDPANQSYRIVHTNAPALAQAVRDRLLERIGADPKRLEVREAGPVIAVHGGPGAVGVVSARE